METWISFTMRIGDKSYKHVRPLKMEIFEESQEYFEGYLWWRREWTEKTGRWYIRFLYDRGPMTSKQSDSIYFDKEADARVWYEDVWSHVFKWVENKPSPPPAPPKPTKTKKDKHLRIIK